MDLKKDVDNLVRIKRIRSCVFFIFTIKRSLYSQLCVLHIFIHTTKNQMIVQILEKLIKVLGAACDQRQNNHINIIFIKNHYELKQTSLSVPRFQLSCLATTASYRPQLFGLLFSFLCFLLGSSFYLYCMTFNNVTRDLP